MVHRVSTLLISRAMKSFMNSGKSISTTHNFLSPSSILLFTHSSLFLLIFVLFSASLITCNQFNLIYMYNISPAFLTEVLVRKYHYYVKIKILSEVSHILFLTLTFMVNPSVFVISHYTSLNGPFFGSPMGSLANNSIIYPGIISSQWIFWNSLFQHKTVLLQDCWIPLIITVVIIIGFNYFVFN